jgi:CRP/FNR family transcriptional regulator, cyclic AMP receptor protein
MNQAAGQDHFPKLEHLGDATPFVGRILEILQHIALFEDFGKEEVTLLAGYMQCYRAPAGSEIIREGQAGDFMVLLLDGEMEIVKQDGRGLPARIGLAGPGKTLGEMSLIDGEPRFASCLTLADTTFAVLDRDHLISVVSEEPKVGVKLLMELLMLLNQRLRQVSGQLMRCLEGKRLRVR